MTDEIQTVPLSRESKKRAPSPYQFVFTDGHGIIVEAVVKTVKTVVCYIAFHTAIKAGEYKGNWERQGSYTVDSTWTRQRIEQLCKKRYSTRKAKFAGYYARTGKRWEVEQAEIRLAKRAAEKAEAEHKQQVRATALKLLEACENSLAHMHAARGIVNVAGLSQAMDFMKEAIDEANSKKPVRK